MFTQNLQKNEFRHERKYAIDYGTYEVLRRRCAAVMKRDRNSVGNDYRITSLYFDDIFKSAYKDKLAGIKSRRKFRIRVYNLNPGRIALENKYKEGERICKKSAVLTADEYEAVMKSDYNFCGERLKKQALRDFYVHARIMGLKPAIIVDYYREAFSAPTGIYGNVRITFDREISSGFGSLDMFKASYSPAFPDIIVLEIKYNNFLPSYIQEMFSGYSLIEEAISKYVICADKLLEVNKIGSI